MRISSKFGHVLIESQAAFPQFSCRAEIWDLDRDPEHNPLCIWLICASTFLVASERVIRFQNTWPPPPPPPPRPPSSCGIPSTIIIFNFFWHRTPFRTELEQSIQYDEKGHVQQVPAITEKYRSEIDHLAIQSLCPVACREGVREGATRAEHPQCVPFRVYHISIYCISAAAVNMTKNQKICWKTYFFAPFNCCNARFDSLKWKARFSCRSHC